MTTGDWPNLERPASPGLMPGLKGVTNGAGLVLNTPVGRMLERNGVTSDEVLAKPACGVLARPGLPFTETDRGWGRCNAALLKVNELIGRLGFRGDLCMTPLDVCVFLSSGDLNAL